ncbi:hypothetical protein MMC29_000248 [Sticta canariensis]|nr:hypothetical protein [Sticta canariensis]
MPGSTECIVSVGSNVKLQWTQARDGSINLSIRLIAGGNCLQEHRKKKHTESWENKDRTVRFQLASSDHHGDSKQSKAGRPGKNGQLRQGDGREHGRRTYDKSKDNQPENNQSEDESEDDQDGETEVVGDETHLASRQIETNIVSACVSCRKISEKVEKEFSKRQKRLRECHSLWMNSPGEFFGDTRIISSEQWSFRALTDSEKKLDQERVPFHKVNLAYHLQKRIEESKLPELTCRKAMLQEIYPGFEKMQRKDRDPLYRRFERYIEQGEALLMITTGIAGILQQSKQYEEVTTTIRTYTQKAQQREGILPIWPQQTIGNSGGAAPRENAPPGSPRKRQRSETGTVQRQDLVGDEQAAESHSPARDSFASTPSAIRNQPVVSAQSNRSHNVNQQDQEPPTWLQSHQQDTHAKQTLLSLICAVGAIPKLMLDRALSPQKRWNEYGVEYQIDPRNARLESHLKVLLLDSDGLWQVLEHLVSIAAVGVEKLNDMEEVYFCGSTSAEYLNSEERTCWVEQALWLFCYVFPRNPTSLSVTERERLWAVLKDLLRLYAETDLEIPSNDEVIETLLAVSKTGPLPRRHLILSVVDPLLKKTANADLLAEAVYQRSVVLRLRGDIAGSNELLEKFLDRSDMAAQLKSHSILGLLHLSQAANDTYNLDFSSASERAKMWSPLNTDATEKQLDVVWSQIHTAGRILRGQGHFDTACLFFERCLQMEPLRKSRRHLALSHLADTYIEVDYLRRQDNSLYTGESLSKAQNLIRPEIECLRSHAQAAQHSKGFRRLLLCLSEIEIRKSRFDEAHRLLVELCDIYGKLVDPDIIDRHGHLRACISLARISPSSETESSWMAALNLGRRYYPLEEEVFVVALMHLFICTARLLKGDMERGKAAFDYAAEICHIKSPQFVMPGLDSPKATILDNLSAAVDILPYILFMKSSRKSVAFVLEPQIRAVTRRPRRRIITSSMEKTVYEAFHTDEGITDELLQEAAKLFSENYGVWDKQAPQMMGKFAKAGAPVRLSREKLRNEYLLSGISSYARVFVDGNLAGNALACRWSVDGKTVCWITQLVVHRSYRERGLARGLLDQINRDGSDIYGVMSSHPAACLAAARAFGNSIDKLSLDFMKAYAESIMKASPVEYVRNAKLAGSLFDPEDTTGRVCCVDSGFFVDHGEPLEALTWVRDTMEWPMGDLFDGHEFLLILEARRRSRSRSSSARRNVTGP